MSPRLGVLAVILVAPALPMLVSAPAHAATNIICVNRPSDTECAVRPADIPGALSLANTDGTDSVIRVGAGTYTGPFDFDPTDAFTLTIQGNGNGSGNQATVFKAAAGGAPYLEVEGATLRNARVEMAGTGGVGVAIRNGAVLQQVFVADTAAAPATEVTGIRIDGSGSVVQETTVNLYRGANNTGVFQLATTSGLPTSMPRVTIRSSSAGLVVEGGSVAINNSLIELGTTGTVGIYATPGAPSTNVDVKATHLTIVGGKPGDSRGVLVLTTNATTQSTVSVVNSIVRGQTQSLMRAADAGTATLTVDYSNYESASGGVAAGDGNLNVDPAFRAPAFAAPADGDYQLRAGSPVVDKGSLLLTIGPDRNGDGRAFDGDGNGSQVPDMGAYELSDITAPTTTFTAGPSGTTNNRQPVFQFRSGTGARFECALDGGAFQACTSPATTPPLADGPHSFTVRATDQAFNVENPPVTRSFTVDTIAPDVTITKKPAKRFFKKRVKFKFAVSEPGATLQCNLDGKGWQKCSSPFKFNTKVGKHVLLVRATDAAGNTDATPAKYKYKRLKRR